MAIMTIGASQRVSAAVISQKIANANTTGVTPENARVLGKTRAGVTISKPMKRENNNIYG